MIPSDMQITEAMIVFGGSFASLLGKLFRAADADNRATLKAAFPELWQTYRDPAMHARLNQSYAIADANAMLRERAK